MRRNNRWLNSLPYLILVLSFSMMMFMGTGSTVEPLSYEEFQTVLEEKTIKLLKNIIVTQEDTIVIDENSNIHLDLNNNEKMKPPKFLIDF